MAPPKESSPSGTRSNKSQDPKTAQTKKPQPSSSAQPSSSQQPPTHPEITVQHSPAIVASVPLIPPPSSDTNTFASYGNLNQHDPAVFIQASDDQLKQIVATTPPTIRRPLPTTVTKEGLLNEVFRLRQHEAMRAMLPDTAPASSLSKLMAMSPQDILNMSEADPTQLQTLMHAALVADPSLSPRNFSLSNPGKMAGTAILWQFQCYKEAQNVQQAPQQHTDQPPSPRRVRFAPTNVIMPTLARDTLPPGTLPSLFEDATSPHAAEDPNDPQPPDDSSDESDDGERRPKKRKSHTT